MTRPPSVLHNCTSFLTQCGTCLPNTGLPKATYQLPISIQKLLSTVCGAATIKTWCCALLSGPCSIPAVCTGSVTRTSQPQSETPNDHHIPARLGMCTHAKGQHVRYAVANFHNQAQLCFSWHSQTSRWQCIPPSYNECLSTHVML